MNTWIDSDIAALIGNTGTFEKGEIIASDFTVLNLIGVGAQSEVYHVKNKSDNREYVIKYFTRSNDDIKYEISVFKAIQSLPRSDHLVLAHPTVRHNEQRILILEYIDGETLTTGSGRKLSFRSASKIILQILAGIQILHHGGIVHRDIKPENIKLSKRGAIVFDFGIAARIGDKTAPDNYTRGFAPPERHPLPTWDTYSIGALFYLLLTGRMPVWQSGQYQPKNAEDQLLFGNELNWRPWIKTYLKRALAFDPSARYQNAESMISDLRNHRAKIRVSR